MTKMWHQNFQRATPASRTSPDGILHHSVEEKRRWCKLQFDEKLGLIRSLQRQVSFPLEIDEQRAVRTPERKSLTTGKMVGGRIMKYTPDFIYSVPDTDANGAPIWREVIEDHKGFMDKVAELRIAVFEAIYQKKVYIHKY